MTTRRASGTPAPGRLSAADWELAALEALAESGLTSVAIEALARRLGVTKGSFYWHFSNRRALLRAALERWEATDRELVLEPLCDIPDAHERLRTLFLRAGTHLQTHAIYAALLQCSDDELVEPVMARVARQRLDFLRQAYCQIGMPEADAQLRARLVYSVYAGFMQLAAQPGLPGMDHEQFEAYINHVIDTLIPGGDTSRPR